MNEISHVARDVFTHYDDINLRLNSPNESALFLAYLPVSYKCRRVLKQVESRLRKSPKQKNRTIIVINRN